MSRQTHTAFAAVNRFGAPIRTFDTAAAAFAWVDDQCGSRGDLHVEEITVTETRRRLSRLQLVRTA